MTDIHGLKPLEDAVQNLYPFFLAAALVVFLILLILAAWVCGKRRKKLGTITPSLPPDREAIENLQTLEDMGLINKGEFKKHYVLLSEIFRNYLERRFVFPAAERTSEEILGKLAALDVTKPLIHQVQTFIGNTDPVKFAQAACTADEAREETGRVRRFVAETGQQIPTTSKEEHVAV